MINYNPLWATMQKQKITKYQLIYHWGMSSNTLRRMAHNEPISTTTLNELCLILNCTVQDIVIFEPDNNELAQLQAKRTAILEKFRRKNKS